METPDITSLISSTEIMIVRQVALERTGLVVNDEILSVQHDLGDVISGRIPVLFLEGDLHRHPSPFDRRPILIHSQGEPSQAKFARAKEQGHAAYLEEQLELIANHNQDHPKVGVVLEAKPGTNEDTLAWAIKLMREHNVPGYIDSYFGRPLHVAREYHDMLISRHGFRIGTINVHLPKAPLPGELESDPDIYTATHLPFVGMGHSRIPLVIGAVTDVESAMEYAMRPDIIGIYWRGDEGGLRTVIANSCRLIKKQAPRR